MQIEFDTAKREKTLEVFGGAVLNRADDRADYGELRFQTFGALDRRLIVMVWTPRGEVRRIISMRHANEREIRHCAQYMG